MKKSGAPVRDAEASELELPDWSGMDDSSARVTADAAFQLCERYRSWFPELAGQTARGREEKCLVEFVL